MSCDKRKETAFRIPISAVYIFRGVLTCSTKFSGYLNDILAFWREVLVLTSIILYGIMPNRIIPIGLIGGDNETKSIFFGEAVTGENFTNRVNKIKRLITDLGGGHNIFLISPRRYGKTSLMKKDALIMQY